MNIKDFEVHDTVSWTRRYATHFLLCFIKWAGPNAGPFQGRQATEVNFARASEASGGPCERFQQTLAEFLRGKCPDIEDVGKSTCARNSCGFDG